MELAGFTNVSTILRAGVYALVWGGEVVYVGKAKNLYSRIYTHRSVYNNRRAGKPVPKWIETRGIRFDEVLIHPCTLEALDALEREMVNRYKPRYNVLLKTQEKILTEVPLRIAGLAVVLNGTVARPLIERRV